MTAEEITYALLCADATLLTVVPAVRIVPGVIPQATALPAIAYGHVSSVEQTPLAGSPWRLVTSRMQVTVAAGSYAAKKDLLTLVRKACNGKRGIYAGALVLNVRRDTVGPDIDNETDRIYTQPIDFFVQWREAV